MKKFLISTLVAASVASCVGGLVACGDKNTGGGNNDADTAQKAIAAVRMLYESKSETTDKDYPVIGQTKVGTTICTVKWTVECEVENWGNYIVVGDPDPDDGNNVTISITKAPGQEISYTLKATVTVGKASESASFNRKIPASQAGEGQTEVKISFDDTAYRSEQSSTSKQIWTMNGITFTNTGSVNLTYYNPVRLYKGSTINIAYQGMTKLIFHSSKNFDDSPYFTYLKDSLEAKNLGTVEVNEESLTVTLTLTSPLDEVEFTASAGQCRLYSIDVVSNNNVTDAEKVAGAKTALDLADKKFGLVREYELPAKQNSLDVKWKVKEGGDNVSITNDGKLKVNSLPQDTATAVLEATITSNDVTDTKDITITLVNLGITNDGTAEHPLTPSEAKSLTKTLLDKGNTSATEYYVKGFVIAPGTYDTGYKNFNDMYIATAFDIDKAITAEDALYIFRPTPDGEKLTTAGFDKGDEVTFKGKLQYYVDKDNNEIPELVNGTCVKRDVPNRNDDEVVTLAKSNVNLAKTTYTDEDTTGVDLPATQNDATLAWTIEGGTSEYVSIEGGKLKVNKLPTTGEATVTIKVTISYKTATPQTKTIDLTLKARATFEEGTYNFALDLSGVTGVAKKYYLTAGSNGDYKSSYYGATTDVVGDAANVVIAASGKGYTLMVGNKYIEVVQSGSNYNFAVVDTPSQSTVWMLDQELKSEKGIDVLTFKVGDKDYYLGTFTNSNNSTRTTIGASAISYITGSQEKRDKIGVSQFVVTYEKVVEKTADEKIAAARDYADDFMKEEYEARSTAYNLPTSNSGAALAWEVVTSKDVVSIANNKMTVTNPTTGEDVTGVQIKVTITCEGGTTVDKTYTFTVKYNDPVNYGTLQAPLSVTEALAIAAAQCANTNDVTKDLVYMTAKVTNVPTDKGNYYSDIELVDLNDTTKTISVNTINLRESSDVEGFVKPAAPAKNDILVICGYMKNLSGTVKFTSNNGVYVYIEKNTRGTSAITVNIQQENEAPTATVTNLSGEALSTSAENGTKVSFKVAPVSGKQVTAVKVNDKKIDAVKDDPEDENSEVHYELTVAGDMTVTVETADEGYVEPEITYTKVTEVSDLKAGDVIILTSSTNVMGTNGSNKYFSKIADGITFNEDDVTAVSNDAVTITLEDAGEGKFYLNIGGKYLYGPSGTASKNELYLGDKQTDGSDKWEITTSGNNVIIKMTVTSKYSSNDAYRHIQFNSDRFSCYASNQSVVTIYKQVVQSQDNNTSSDE